MNFNEDYFNGRRGSFRASPPKKDPTIEMQLQCTLEELYTGTQKKFKITKRKYDAFDKELSREDIIKQIDIKPGWKKGFKLVFDQPISGFIETFFLMLRDKNNLRQSWR